MLVLSEYILEFLNSETPVFNTPINGSEEKSDSIKTEGSYKPMEPSTDLEKKIVEVLEEYVTPAVAKDGGAIHFHSFDKGQLSVVLKGACSGCPSSTMTLKNGIESLMTRMVPEVTEVVAHEGWLIVPISIPSINQGKSGIPEPPVKISDNLYFAKAANPLYPILARRP